MKSVDLNANWNIVGSNGEHIADLPYDMTCGAERDYTLAFGTLNGYIPAAHATMTKALPVVRHGNAYIIISGALGYGDVYVNDEIVGRLCGYAPTRIDVTDRLTGLHNTLRLELTSSPEMNDKYVGLGIGGGVKLVTEDDVDMADGSLFVKTLSIGDKTYADVDVDIFNYGDEPVKMILECTATNSRGKRCGKKQRKIYLRAHSEKTFCVKVRMTSSYEWSIDDPYMYGMTVKLLSDSGEEQSAMSTRFGVTSRYLNSLRGLYINGKNTDLIGAYVSHADALLGGVSIYSNEKRRFEALKALGYNAVHFVECPSEAALNALDDIGMYAYVDIFGALVEGKAPLDRRVLGRVLECAESIVALRNHPCVVMYGVADDVPECYGRHGGHAIISELAEIIRSFDPTRPLTVSSREFVPTAKELEDAGIKKRIDGDAAAINAGREKDLFVTLTKGAFSSVDVCGFNYLYPLYSSDWAKNGRLIVGSRTDPARAVESIEETEKNLHVIGDFGDCGIDYPGGGTLNEILTTRGDLDAVCDEKVQGVYKRIILGERNVAYITVLDPDTDEPVPMWNWPRYLGQEVTVRIYTSGDVAALYLDGKLIGRKLAGKINGHIATFTTEYYPGTLEAVCYFKGVECARAQLKTAGSPKTTRLTVYEKNLSLSRGDIGFVHIDVCDKEGNLVPYAMRTLSAQVTGGSIVGFINADPMLRKTSADTCPAYGGKALLAIKPDEEGKVTVKVTSDGLTASKISFKVKD